jgi:hypothetical protein
MSERLERLSEHLRPLAERLGQVTEPLGQSAERLRHFAERRGQVSECSDRRGERLAQVAETLRRFVGRLDPLARRLRRLAERLFREGKSSPIAATSRRRTTLAPSTLYKHEGSDLVSRARTNFRRALEAPDRRRVPLTLYKHEGRDLVSQRRVDLEGDVGAACDERPAHRAAHDEQPASSPHVFATLDSRQPGSGRRSWRAHRCSGTAFHRRT